MTIQSDLARYQGLLQERAEFRKREMDLEVELDALKLRMELTAATPKLETVNANAVFIAKHAGKLNPEDVEFLAEEYRGTGEVAGHISRTETTLKRFAKSGKLQANKLGKRWLFSTVSVMEYVLKSRGEER